MITGIIRDAYTSVSIGRHVCVCVSVRACACAACWLGLFLVSMHSLFRTRARIHTHTEAAILARSCNCIVKVLQSDSRRLCQWKRIGIASRRVASRRVASTRLDSTPLDSHRRSIERGSLDAVKVVQPPLRGSSFENPRHVRHPRHVRRAIQPRGVGRELEPNFSTAARGKKVAFPVKKADPEGWGLVPPVIPVCPYSILSSRNVSALRRSHLLANPMRSLQLLVVMRLSLRVHYHFLHRSLSLSCFRFFRVLNARGEGRGRGLSEIKRGNPRTIFIVRGMTECSEKLETRRPMGEIRPIVISLYISDHADRSCCTRA